MLANRGLYIFRRKDSSIINFRLKKFSSFLFFSSSFRLIFLFCSYCDIVYFVFTKELKKTRQPVSEQSVLCSNDY